MYGIIDLMMPKLFRTLNTVKREVFKQRNVDNGELGGAYSVFLGTFALLGFATFVNTSISTYQTFWNRYFTATEFVLIIVSALVFGMWFYYAVFTPSQQKYANRQSYNHDNLIRKDIIRVEKKMDSIVESVGILKLYAKFNGK